MPQSHRPGQGVGVMSFLDRSAEILGVVQHLGRPWLGGSLVADSSEPSDGSASQSTRLFNNCENRSLPEEGGGHFPRINVSYLLADLLPQ